MNNGSQCAFELRIRPVLNAKLEKLAKQDRRTLSAYVEKVLEDHVEGVAQLRRVKERTK
jgi:predicted DNA-binding protein